MSDSTTVTILIGNSDDKLPQARWSDFVRRVDRQVKSWSEKIHFFGFSPGDAQWQNACWVIEIGLWGRKELMRCLGLEAGSFGQDSVAWAEAPGTVFLKGG